MDVAPAEPAARTQVLGVAVRHGDEEGHGRDEHRDFQLRLSSRVCLEGDQGVAIDRSPSQQTPLRSWPYSGRSPGWSSSRSRAYRATSGRVRPPSTATSFAATTDSALTAAHVPRALHEQRGRLCRTRRTLGARPRPKPPSSVRLIELATLQTSHVQGLLSPATPRAPTTGRGEVTRPAHRPPKAGLYSCISLSSPDFTTVSMDPPTAGPPGYAGYGDGGSPARRPEGAPSPGAWSPRAPPPWSLVFAPIGVRSLPR